LAEAQARLQAVSRRLRETPHLGPEAREDLAALVDELGQLLQRTPVPSPEMAHLADSTAHLLQALHQGHDPGLLTAARDRLGETIVNVETRAPFAAGIARRLIDALANLGI
jgi:hypothetical protein